MSGTSVARLDVVTGRVRDAKEVMQDGPHVPIAVARLALADVEDDHPRESAFLFGRLHREREPVTTPQMNTTDLRFKRTGEPVGTQLICAWVALKVLVDLAVSGASTLKCFDERAHGTRRNDFVGVHAAEVWPPQRTRSVFWAERLGRCGRNEVALSESGEARTVERLELTLVRGVSALQHADHAGDEIAFLAPVS